MTIFEWTLIAHLGYMTSTGYVDRGRVRLGMDNREACVAALRAMRDVRQGFCVNRQTGEIAR